MSQAAPLRHGQTDDTLILLLALASVPLVQGERSVAGTVARYLGLAIDHRGGRYIAN